MNKIKRQLLHAIVVTIPCILAIHVAVAQSADVAVPGAAPDSVKVGLALRYLKDRIDFVPLFNSPMLVQDWSSESVLDVLLQDLNHSPEWNSSHPNWAKARSLMKERLERYRTSMKALFGEASQVDKAERLLAKDIAGLLSVEDLNAIISFYESPGGARFMAVHKKLFEVFPESYSRGVRSAMEQKPGNKLFDKNQGPPLDLFFEYLMFQAAMRGAAMDGGDKSEPDEFLMWAFAIAITGDRERLEGIWNSLSASEREKTRAYWASPACEKERAALAYAFYDLAEVMNPGKEAQQSLKALYAEITAEIRKQAPK